MQLMLRQSLFNMMLTFYFIASALLNIFYCPAFISVSCSSGSRGPEWAALLFHTTSTFSMHHTT